MYEDIIPAPLRADCPPNMHPMSKAVWSPHWMVMAVNLHREGETILQSLDLRSQRLGTYLDDPEMPDMLTDADRIAARLLVQPRRLYVCGERHGERKGRQLFRPQIHIRYMGVARTPLERLRQGDDQYDAQSDRIAN